MLIHLPTELLVFGPCSMQNAATFGQGSHCSGVAFVGQDRYVVVDLLRRDLSALISMQ